MLNSIELEKKPMIASEQSAAERLEEIFDNDPRIASIRNNDRALEDYWKALISRLSGVVVK